MYFNDNIYLRIGTEYYKIVDEPINETETDRKVIPWKKQTIIDDYGKDYLKTVETFEGFTSIPSHTNYKAEINGFYNRYEDLDHQLATGHFPKIKAFLHHIFGEHYELGLDYFSILWHYPKQILPVLCLVSTERNTGKTTFLNFLKLVFKGNMTMNKNEDFRSRFNSDWAGKLIISVDEVLLDRIEDSERIKNLSTAGYYKSESKGKDKQEIPFFGKFILCSNNEENFIKIDSEEIRYWVRKVPVLPRENQNPDLMEKLEKEIPFFLEFINSRKIETSKTSRMWFDPLLIRTKALDVLINGNKTYLEKELIELISDKLNTFDQDSLCYTANDLSKLLKENGLSVPNHRISKFLKEKWKLESTNSTYELFHYSAYDSISGRYHDSTTSKGRFFRFTREFLNNL